MTNKKDLPVVTERERGKGIGFSRIRRIWPVI